MTNPGVRVVEDRLHLPSKALKRFAIEVASNQGLEFRVAQGCIGMGQAPAAGKNSLRTFPRNFPGRSGTEEDAVWLCSPETGRHSTSGTTTEEREMETSSRMERSSTGR